MNLEERVEQLEFQVQLLFDDSAISRYLFETKITKTQYHKIMDFMDTMRKKIDNDEEIHYRSFEQGIYDIVPERKGDFHFCEILAKLFAEEGRWEEVFPALYGGMAQHGGRTNSNSGEQFLDTDLSI